MTSQLAKSNRGGGSSNRGGGKSQVVKDTQFHILQSAGIDTTGTGDMQLIRTYTFIKTSITVELKPDGRKCLTCIFTDDVFCPVAIACQRIRRFIHWGKPPHPDGTTNGNYCSFCARHYATQIKKARVPAITMGEYERFLGGDVKRLEGHQLKITIGIKLVIDKGGRLSSHIDWVAAEKKALVIQKKQSLTKRKPGLRHLELAFYTEKYGDLQTNGMLQRGHRLWTLDGTKGVLVPDDPVTYLEFTEELSAIMTQEVASTEGPDAVSGQELGSLQSSIAGSFWHESSGGVNKAIEDLMNAAAPSGSSEQLGSSTDGDSIADLFRLGASIDGTAAPQTALPLANISESGGRTKAKARAKPVASPDSSPSHSPRDMPAPAAGNRHGQNPRDGAAAGRDGRGRPKKDWDTQITCQCAEFSSSQRTNQLLWGAESKTKLNQYAQFEKDIKQRVRNAADIEEVSTLKMLLKKLSAMSALVDVIARYGLGSAEFKAIYDLQVSQLALSPTVTLDFPDFLKWSRKSMDINESDEVSVWLRRTSSDRLRASGVPSVLDEQYRLWAEKLASILRLDKMAECKLKLKEVYSLDIEYDLEDTIAEFVSAFAICISYEDFDQLIDRVDFLSESLAKMDEHIPSAGQSRGSILGTTVSTFPVGSKMVADARVRLAKARLTINALDPFFHLLAGLHEAVKRVCGSLLSTNDQVFEVISDNATDLAQHFKKKMVNVLPGYVPSPNTPEVKDALTCWLLADWQASVSLVKPALRRSTTAEALSDWAKQSSGARSRVSKVHLLSLALKPLMDTNGSLCRNVMQCHGLIQWLSDVAESLQKRSDELDVVQKLQKGFKEYLKPFMADEGIEVPSVIDSQMSPVFSKEGAYAAYVKGVLHDRGNAQLKPLKIVLVAIFPSVPLRLMSVESYPDASIKAISDSTLPKSEVQSCLKWATDTADSLLHIQLQCCSLVRDLFVSVCNAEIATRKYFRTGIAINERKVSDVQIEILHDLRSTFGAFEKFVEGSLHAFDSEEILKDHMHVNCFDDIMDLKSVHASVQSEVRRLESRFGSSWSEDFNKIVAAVTAYCPRWHDKKECLLSERGMVTEMMNMSEKHVNAIGPLCHELKAMEATVKKLTNGCKLVDANFMKTVHTTIQFGIETVVYRSILVCTEKDWHSLSSPAECAAAVKELRERINGKGVELSDELQECLDSWESGDKLEELELAREAAKSRQSVAAPPPEAAQAQDDAGDPMAMNVDPAPAEASQIQSKASEPQQDDKEHVGAKRSLFQRAAASKRRKDGK